MSGYEGEGTSLSGGYEDEGTDLSGGFDGSDPGSGWGGITNTAGYAQHQGVGGLSQDKSLTGFNAENPTQTVGEFENAQSVDGFMNFAAPAFMSAMAPGFGLISGATKTAANVLSGMPIGQAVAGYAGGFINGKLNEATGGLYGKANMASGVARSLGVDMPSLNVGGALASAAFGGKSFGSAAPATAATSASDFVAQGVDSGGWRKRTGDTT